MFDPTGITGQPIVWYEGTGTGAANRRYLSADERGSIISVSDSSGASLAVNKYDEFGMPSFGALANQRFGYTGQMWIGSAQLYYYKARMYAPQIGGRFLQPDPIGYVDSPNLYAYVLNDPVNFIDPLGLVACPGEVMIRGPGAPTYTDEWGNIVVTGSFICVPLTELYTPNRDRGGEAGGGGGGGGDAAIQRNVPPCMQKFLASKGYGAPNLPKITFRRGAQGNLAAMGAHASGYPALTWGNNVYIAPSAWDRGQFSSGTSGFFEEVIHSIQWGQSGRTNFISGYLFGVFGGALMTGNPYNSPIELEAKAISERLEREYRNDRTRCP